MGTMNNIHILVVPATCNS